MRKDLIIDARTYKKLVVVLLESLCCCASIPSSSCLSSRSHKPPIILTPMAARSHTSRPNGRTLVCSLRSLLRYSWSPDVLRPAAMRQRWTSTQVEMVRRLRMKAHWICCSWYQLITAPKTAVKLWFISAGDLIQPQDKGKGEVATRRFIPPLIPRDRYHL